MGGNTLGFGFTIGLVSGVVNENNPIPKAIHPKVNNIAFIVVASLSFLNW